MADTDEIDGVQFRALMIEKHGPPNGGEWLTKVMGELAAAGVSDPVEQRGIAQAMVKYRP